MGGCFPLKPPESGDGEAKGPVWGRLFLRVPLYGFKGNQRTTDIVGREHLD